MSTPSTPTPGSADVLVGKNNNNNDADVLVGKNNNNNDANDADGDVGAPRGWYSRGYLPHRDDTHLIQSVTYRLADSLPQTKLAELQKEMKHLPEKQREVERRKRIEEWLDAGMGCCALAHPDVALYVQNSFLHFHGERYHLHAWCIMPNHVHVLIEPLVNLASIVQGWKSYTARWILGKNEQFALKIPRSNQLWMREYWDRYIRDARHYQRAVEYIHQNPVKAKLCDAAEAWPWSSAFPGNADVPVGRRGRRRSREF